MLGIHFGVKPSARTIVGPAVHLVESGGALFNNFYDIVGMERLLMLFVLSRNYRLYYRKQCDNLYSSCLQSCALQSPRFKLNLSGTP